MLDVLLRPSSRAESMDEKSDLKAVQGGEKRLVRSYLKPQALETRRHWKPGYIEVSSTQLVWKGSSHKWASLSLAANEWEVRVRRIRADERVYKTWTAIDCMRREETWSLAVPRPDVELCVAILRKETRLSDSEG
jgi:hypothetical protein